MNNSNTQARKLFSFFVLTMLSTTAHCEQTCSAGNAECINLKKFYEEYVPDNKVETRKEDVNKKLSESVDLPLTPEYLREYEVVIFNPPQQKQKSMFGSPKTRDNPLPSQEKVSITLIEAAEGGKIEIIKILLSRKETKLDQNSINLALRAAAGNGNEEIVQLLLTNDAMKPNQDGVNEAFIKAVKAIKSSKSKNLEVGKILLENEYIKPNQQGLSEALTRSITMKKEDDIKKEITLWILKNQSVKINQSGINEALAGSIEVGNQELVEIMLNNAAIKPDQTGINNAFTMAADSGKQEIVQTLLENKHLKPDQVRINQVVTTALVAGNMGFIKFLKDQGAESDQDGLNNSLAKLIEAENEKLVEIFLKKLSENSTGKNKFNQQGINGAFASAAGKNNADLVKKLLKIDWIRPDDEGFNRAIEAVANSNPTSGNLVNELLEKRNKHCKLDQQATTAVYVWAIKNDDANLMLNIHKGMMGDKKPDPELVQIAVNEALIHATKKGDAKLVKRLLTESSFPEKPDVESTRNALKVVKNGDLSSKEYLNAYLKKKNQ